MVPGQEQLCCHHWPRHHLDGAEHLSACSGSTIRPVFTPIRHHMVRGKERKWSQACRDHTADLLCANTASGKELVKTAAYLVKTKIFCWFGINFCIKCYPHTNEKSALIKSHALDPHNPGFLYFPTNKRQRALLALHAIFPRAGEPFPTLAQSLDLLQAKQPPTIAIFGVLSLLFSAPSPQTPPQILFDITSEAKVQPKRKYFKYFLCRKREKQGLNQRQGGHGSTQPFGVVPSYHCQAELTFRHNLVWNPQKMAQKYSHNPTRLSAKEILLKAFQLLETFMATSRCVYFKAFFLWPHSHLWRS